MSKVARYNELLSTHLDCAGDIYVGGMKADEVNAYLIRDCLMCWTFLVEDILLKSNLSLGARRARVKNFLDSIYLNDFQDVVACCKSAYYYLISDRATTYGDFKGHIAAEVPTFRDLGGFLSPISVCVSLFLEDREHNVSSLALATLFLRFPVKLHLEGSSLEEEAVTKYLKDEERLATWCLQDVEEEFLSDLEQIIGKWLRGFRVDIRPNHGGGSVADPNCRTTYQKYHQLYGDKFLEVVLDNKWVDGYMCNFFPLGYRGGLDRCSKTIFVPKNFSSLRTISMEPATLQYFQQGVMKDLYGFLGRHPKLSKIVDLKSQGINQMYAWKGSKDGSHATLDLSAASDSVSWSLVKRVFAKSPNLLKWLYATRSRDTVIASTGQRLRLKKFAPMGSSLCFPIMCILLAAVCEHAVRKFARQLRGSTSYVVYGDDMIIPSQLYGYVTTRLAELGFRVNDDKSYAQGPFRESCGKDYYLGHDVSGLYWRLKGTLAEITPEVYSALCSIANLAVERDLVFLRLFCVKQLTRSSYITRIDGRDIKRRIVPHFCGDTSTSPSLYSKTPTNFHARVRWNKDYQRSESQVTTVSSRPFPGLESNDSELIRYHATLVQMSRRSITPSLPHLDEKPGGVILHGSRVLFSRAWRSEW